MTERASGTQSPRDHSRLIGSPVLWAAALTAGFYAVLPYVPFQRELLQRYFCGHPLEYATAALFFLGMAILARKAFGISAETASLARDPLADAHVLQSDARAPRMDDSAVPRPPDRGTRPTGGLTATGGVGRPAPNERLPNESDPLARAAAIEHAIARLPARMGRTHLVLRLRDACAFLRGRRSAEGLEEHLKYLAEQADARTHESYGLVRTITWAVPIIGFLGTVIGITIAIANVTPEQLDTSLSTVTGGLAVAFDTTALALTLSLVLVFASFLVSRAEQRVLMQVEDYGTKRLLVLFPASAGPHGSLESVQRHAAQTLLARTESLINWQTELWQEALEALRERWTSTLADQQGRLDETLREGMAVTLDDHGRQLAAVRSEFLHAFAGVSKQLSEQLAESRDADRETHQAFCFQLDALWQRVRAELAGLRDTEARRLDELAGAVCGTVADWQKQLETCTAAAADQTRALERQTDSLERLVGTGSELLRLEERLQDNLEAVRAAETFEQTLHSLSAAVHLLTARAASKAA